MSDFVFLATFVAVWVTAEGCFLFSPCAVSPCAAFLSVQSGLKVRRFVLTGIARASDLSGKHRIFH